MLFFWEEEALRWRLLEQEEAEIQRALDEEGNEGMKRELEVRKEGVRMRMGMRPSRREGRGSVSSQGGSGGRVVGGRGWDAGG